MTDENTFDVVGVIRGTVLADPLELIKTIKLYLETGTNLKRDYFEGEGYKATNSEELFTEIKNIEVCVFGLLVIADDDGLLDLLTGTVEAGNKLLAHRVENDPR